ncbi:response regulator transcription factor [Chengkuizengella axinellae]|uniref:Response regulator n=1 Tax=Chengkuizengella axinellae TaxID=3064388 RepID=A0ABT9J0P7_9BACL|nr:response regulator [Chengkuizengella sp. 2205SS18-9]MDP5275157.1 response regulator [Chengkuizengella sp. 2205SS18-9]
MNILMVDDEPIVRNAMANMIRTIEDDYEVQTAEDGEDAISKLKNTKFDIVITDIRMPGMDGLQLAKYIYESNSKTYVVMLTGHADFEYARTALQYKVVDYLLKPTSVESVREIISKIEMMINNRKSKKEIGRLREKNLLEKRVQDLFYEMPVPYYDESLFPEFQSIYLFSITMKPEELRKKTIRFSLKNIITDVLSEMGTSIVVVEESHITTLLFSQKDQTKKYDAVLKNITNAIEQILKRSFEIGIGGVSGQLNDVSKLYKKSLKELGLYKEEEQVKKGKSNESIHRLIRSVIEFVENDYDKEITLTSLAEQLFVNPNYLSSLFKSEMGVTFSHYVTKTRINKAKDLLKETNHKIYQICKMVGYTDQAHFSKVFKAFENMSPYDYREQSKSQHKQSQ